MWHSVRKWSRREISRDSPKITVPTDSNAPSMEILSPKPKPKIAKISPSGPLSSVGVLVSDDAVAAHRKPTGPQVTQSGVKLRYCKALAFGV